MNAADQLPALTDRLRRARRALDREVGEARHVAALGVAVSAEIADLDRLLALHERAAVVLNSLGETRQHTLQAQIETLVTRGLQTIFGPDLSFHLVPSVKAKTNIIDFVVRSTLDGTEVDTDVMDSRGGGLAATIGFLLRLIIAMLSHDQTDTPLLLDETFAHVSAEYLPKVAAFIRELVDLTRVQVVLVTHADVFGDVADVTYRFTNTGGATTVTTG